MYCEWSVVILSLLEAAYLENGFALKSSSDNPKYVSLPTSSAYWNLNSKDCFAIAVGNKFVLNLATTSFLLKPVFLPLGNVLKPSEP